MRALVLVLGFALMTGTVAGASVQGAAAVVAAVGAVADLIDRLAAGERIDEAQLGLAWRDLHDAEARLPSAVKAQAAGSGAARGYVACDVVLANAMSAARLGRTDDARTATAEARRCYARALAGTNAPNGTCSVSSPSIVRFAQYAPGPPGGTLVVLCPGVYQGYTRGYNGALLGRTRRLRISQLSPGVYELRELQTERPRSLEAWKIRAIATTTSGANYLTTSTRDPLNPRSPWRALDPPAPIRIVLGNGDRQEYDVYFSPGKPRVSSEAWVMDTMQPE